MQQIVDLTGKILGLPVLTSEHGKDVDSLIIYVHLLMAVLFIGWFGYFVYALFRFRKSRHPKADYTGVTSHASTYVEVLVAVVEAVLLFGVAIPFWAKAVDQFPSEKDSTVVRVVAQQFAWNFRYPGKDNEFGKQEMRLITPTNPWGIDPNDAKGKDDISTLNELHVPVQKPVIVYISSKDVIHSFKVIALRITQDAIPGMMIPAHFTALKTGKYQINCAQLCGNGHSGMASGFLIVETPEEYQKWLDGKSKAGPAQTFE
jgi:cytochrome c oxidase subunit 2